MTKQKQYKDNILSKDEYKRLKVLKQNKKRGKKKRRK
jgi:hypothetical protein